MKRWSASAASWSGWALGLQATRRSSSKAGAGCRRHGLILRQECICRKLGNKNGLHANAIWHPLCGALPEAVDLHKEEERSAASWATWTVCKLVQATRRSSSRSGGRLPEAWTCTRRAHLPPRNLDSLQISLGNQANILYAGAGCRRHGPAQEEERICRELGNQDGLQGSLGNQALSFIPGAGCRRPWSCTKKRSASARIWAT